MGHWWSWGKEDRRDNDDDEGYQCGCLPVQIRCSCTVMATLLPHKFSRISLPLRHKCINAHTSARFSLAQTQTLFTVHSLALCHSTTFVKAISSRRQRTADNHTHGFTFCPSTSLLSPCQTSPPSHGDTTSPSNHFSLSMFFLKGCNLLRLPVSASIHPPKAVLLPPLQT